EDLVSRPDAVRRAVFAFLSLEDHDPQIELRDGNRDYRVGQPA
ncbi:MAG TPA: sulfotransferase, partial [Erythrobacter sp.]|nr:sulfotransferase [Erythrobacter sp.]